MFPVYAVVVKNILICTPFQIIKFIPCIVLEEHFVFRSLCLSWSKYIGEVVLCFADYLIHYFDFVWSLGCKPFGLHLQPLK